MAEKPLAAADKNLCAILTHSLAITDLYHRQQTLVFLFRRIPDDENRKI